jgi:Integrase core domain
MLVISDRYSKHIRVIPLPSITAERVAFAFFNNWICCYGKPLIFLSDKGSQFVSRFFQAVCATLDVRQLLTSTYHPQTNGQVERFNRTILSSLTHFVAANQNDWDTLALAHTYGYNSQVHASTSLSPFELVLSRPPTVGVMETRPISASNLSKPEFRTTFLRKVQQLATTATESIRRQQQRYKDVYDAHVRERNRDIRPGDLVFVKTFSHQTDVSPKLLFPAAGPYVVI